MTWPCDMPGCTKDRGHYDDHSPKAAALQQADEQTLASTPAHYFVFRPHMGPGPRPCGECGLSWDDGDHIEINTLDPHSTYVCPSGGGMGHSSVYTGDGSHPELRGLKDHICVCGLEFVKEDDETWELTWEMSTGGPWRQVKVTLSRHASHQQRDGLLRLIEEGEPIRNVELVQVKVVRV